MFSVAYPGNIDILAILYYDFILTLPLEIDRFWVGSRSLSTVSLVFFMNRYLSVAFSIPGLYASFGLMSELVSKLLSNSLRR